VSLDFPNPEMQDRFRGAEGAFDGAVKGIQNARRAGLEVQINCTITKMNMPYLESLVSLAIDLGVVSFHPFVIVPTGRGKGLKNSELTPAECERVLRWIAQRNQEIGDTMTFRPTCAPFYWRIADREEALSGQNAAGAARRGCLAGSAFCFISHVGQVQGCGYLDVAAGNVRQQRFGEVWRDSPFFKDLRDSSRLKGKCGVCNYQVVCGGCRARAYEATGDYLEAEPYCAYQPPLRHGGANA
jgi:radical SAM protein with 4Fe4S-binding SPASM domain